MRVALQSDAPCTRRPTIWLHRLEAPSFKELTCEVQDDLQASVRGRGVLGTSAVGKKYGLYPGPSCGTRLSGGRSQAPQRAAQERGV